MGNRAEIVFVLASGRCGSTLLDVILNGHSRILSLGELVALNAPSRPYKGPSAIWRDDFVAPYVKFWGDVGREYRAITGSSLVDADLRHPRFRQLRSVDGEALTRWLAPTNAIYRAARDVSGKDIVVDASKAFQRLFLLQRSGEVPLKVIHMVRDGRAVSLSYGRRYGSVWAGFKTWVISAAGPLLARHRLSQLEWLVVRYEELATDPEGQARRVCEFLHVDFEPNMMHFRNHPYFGVDGSPTFLRDPSDDVKLDSRWKVELGHGNRALFAIVGGWLNRLYGYPALRS